MTSPANSNLQNLLPVQAYFDLQGNFQTFIGQNKPFFATISPYQSGLIITNSTIDSTTIGATTPSTGVFTNVTTTTGQISATPAGSTDIANKGYVDAVASGLSFKQPVLVTTTANITLSGLQTIDGVTLVAGNRVLVKNQSNTALNGIYVASSGAWSYASDANVYADYPSAFLFVEQGTTWGGSAWVCTSQPGGTLGTTPITFVQFSNNATYTAGTGLTLSGFQFSITNTAVTAGSYGSASSIPTYTVNAQGQLTAASSTAIAISASQVTSGTFDSSLLSGSYTGITGVGTLTAGVWNATPIANAYLANSSITINGNAVSLGGSTTVTASTPNAATFNNSGTGAASGVTFNGSSAQTISYNTIGAPSTTGTGASGTWGISISGNAATATSAGSATTATTATNLAGGLAGSVPYQTGAGATTFLNAGTSGQVLSTTGSAVQWIGPSAFLDNITTTQGSIIYRNASGWVSLAPSTSGYLLQTGGAGANPSWLAQSSVAAGSATTATTATNIAGGAASQLVYQSGSGTTAFIANGTTGQFLTSNGSSAPSWATVSTSITISDQTTSASTYYPAILSATSGSTNTINTSSTKLSFVPSTGVLTATSFSGAGTGLTGTASGLSIGGNAATATSATSATTATNLAGGANGSVPYQTGSGATTFLAAGTNGYILTLAGGVPTWAAAPATGVTITDDTTSATAYYPLYARVTTGTASTEYTSSTKYTYKPSTGELTAPINIASNGLQVNNQTVSVSYTIPSGSSAVSAGPITMSGGVTVTVPGGSRWVIL
jgi:hypothetical protein